MFFHSYIICLIKSKTFCPAFHRLYKNYCILCDKTINLESRYKKY